MTTRHAHITFAEAPPRRPLTLAERLKAAGDDCWRSAQLVVFFLVAGVVFSGPPAHMPIFTPAVSMAAGVRGAQSIDVRPVSRAIEASEPGESASESPADAAR